MAVTIFEVLQNAQYNLRNNGSIGLVIGMEQLNNAIEQIEAGKGLGDEFEEDE
jgi:diacylglycerol kinase